MQVTVRYLMPPKRPLGQSNGVAALESALHGRADRRGILLVSALGSGLHILLGRMHIAELGGSWCGTKRQRCGVSGSPKSMSI